jgi:methylthioribose-1-phosphate isomerase
LTDTRNASTILNPEGNVKTVEWTAEGVRLIDQRILPTREEYVTCRTVDQVAEAIRDMVVRGAPAIGVTAALGIALGMQQSKATTLDEWQSDFSRIASLLGATRPTAVNLFWAIERMRAFFQGLMAQGLGREQAQMQLITEAQRVLEEDIAACKAMGDYGADLVPAGQTVMTICNAGALATAGYGTALGVIRSAVRQGKNIDVLSLETRPFLQGARLTAWELQKDGIPTTLITDNMAGHFLKSGLDSRKIGCVVVGADRIAANGDTANKIGTYGVAVLAKENGVPFYVAAPLSTIDLKIPSGEHIPIEQRSSLEVTQIQRVPIAPQGIAVRNPAFDVTPHRYIAAIITEKGIAQPPFGPSLARLKQG